MEEGGKGGGILKGKMKEINVRISFMPLNRSVENFWEELYHTRNPCQHYFTTIERISLKKSICLHNFNFIF